MFLGVPRPTRFELPMGCPVWYRITDPRKFWMRLRVETTTAGRIGDIVNSPVAVE